MTLSTVFLKSSKHPSPSIFFQALLVDVPFIKDIVRTAIGGMNVTETVEGLERYPVNLRYPRGRRDSVEKLKDLAVVTPSGQQIPLSAVADIRVEDGPPMIKSENARLNGWIFVDIEGVDLGTYVAEARQAVSDQVELPAGYSLIWPQPSATVRCCACGPS